jgi:hypothetical protein
VAGWCTVESRAWPAPTAVCHHCWPQPKILTRQGEKKREKKSSRVRRIYVLTMNIPLFLRFYRKRPVVYTCRCPPPPPPPPIHPALQQVVGGTPDIVRDDQDLAHIQWGECLQVSLQLKVLQFLQLLLALVDDGDAYERVCSKPPLILRFSGCKSSAEGGGGGGQQRTLRSCC